MTMSSNHKRMLRRFMKKTLKVRGDEKEYKNQRLLGKFMKKKGKARVGHQKDYKKHEFLRFIVETAMKIEKMDINTDDHIDRKLQKKIDDMRERRRSILVDQLHSKKHVFTISCQPPLMEKEANFKEVVEVDDDDDDYDYEKEVMKKKTAKKSNTDDKKKEKNKEVQNDIGSFKPSPLPPSPSLSNEEVSKLMLDRISKIGGTDPVWLASKHMEKSDVNHKLGRLFIPKCDALLNFLTQEEKNFLIEEEKKKVKVGIPCRVVDQNGVRWDLRFRYWPSVRQFIFIRGWNSVVKGFGLTLGNPGKIELWCFRLPKENSDLCFGLRITV